MPAPQGNTNHLIHGGRGTRLYSIWKTMRQRCNNPQNYKYARYGGRGIEICSEWDDFAVFRRWAFENGYSPDLTLDRINVDGNYSPYNCRWVNMITQANNKTNNVFIEFDGTKFTMAEFCRVKNIKYKSFAKYIKLGLSVIEALKKAS